MRQLRTRMADKLTLANLYQAHLRAQRHKKKRGDLQIFNYWKLATLDSILEELEAGKYQPSPYRKFYITDPKKRLILALPYRDRVIHQWYVEEFIKPYYVPRFIRHSYACIPGRGSHRAALHVQQDMRRMQRQYGDKYYFMKMDVRKFFYNINPNILYDILARVITDPKLLQLTKTIIFDGDRHDGIPIGNYTSQYFANIYLNELDQFCKHELGIKYYTRYMDDVVALAPDKTTARRWFRAIQNFLQDHLDLELNSHSRYYPANSFIDFAGFKIYHDHRLLRRRSKNKLQEIIKDYLAGQDLALQCSDAARRQVELENNRQNFVQRVNSWYGHAMYADSFRFTTGKLSDFDDSLDVLGMVSRLNKLDAERIAPKRARSF